MKRETPELSIILPCRNEEQALPICLNQIKEIIKKERLNAEIIVSDSSTDKSPEIAIKNNVILIKHNKEGYGNAYLEGFEKAKGKYIFMADSDLSYDFNYIPKFLNSLKENNDLIIGNRFSNKMEKNSMPLTHKYLGNPILSFTLRLLFQTKIKDSHCGMRAIKKEALEKLNLRTTGMELASEMIIKALKNNLKIKEIPISYKKRIGNSKLNPISDAWRHFRFMLLYSPLFLFFIPGLILLLTGINTFILLYAGKLKILGIQLYIHPLFISSLLTITGYQLIIFSIFAKTYAITHLNEQPIFKNLYKHLTLEKALILGTTITFVGLLIYLSIFYNWINTNLGNLNQIKNSILALTLTTIGIQTIFSAFILSILGIEEK
ncbi:dolichol-P-glucose synthetase [Candidatus Pacearchaeota archaeon]|jgi:glycosyltransferase involved in cell wall biosynthesis|nr:dolichol-P-glucose synthetase [Candidatus Pacearchaeota archaeon]|tara:strand:+ start:7210 stop:8343 length:1134 start_codon:yes stop_codon:yes gene_type:complete